MQNRSKWALVNAGLVLLGPVMGTVGSWLWAYHLVPTPASTPHSSSKEAENRSQLWKMKCFYCYVCSGFFSTVRTSPKACTLTQPHLPGLVQLCEGSLSKGYLAVSGLMGHRCRFKLLHGRLEMSKAHQPLAWRWKPCPGSPPWAMSMGNPCSHAQPRELGVGKSEHVR